MWFQLLPVFVANSMMYARGHWMWRQIGLSPSPDSASSQRCSELCTGLILASGTVAVVMATVPASPGHLRESDERAAFVTVKNYSHRRKCCRETLNLLPAKLLLRTSSYSGSTLPGRLLSSMARLKLCTHPLCCGCIFITSPLSAGLALPSLPTAGHLFVSLSLFPDDSPPTGFLDLTCLNLAIIPRLWPRDLTQQLRQPISDVHLLLFKFSLLWPNSLWAVEMNFPKPHVACVTPLLRTQRWSRLPLQNKMHMRAHTILVVVTKATPAWCAKIAKDRKAKWNKINRLLLSYHFKIITVSIFIFLSFIKMLSNCILIFF